MDKRFIEESFPIKEIGYLSKKEDGIKKGHIRSLHKWWARRPLTVSRATIFASLIQYSKSKEISDFIVQLSQWENSNNNVILKKAIQKIQNDYNGNIPKILDPFSGGGSIPLESLRLGCDVYATDYNPVSILILLCTLIYPQKFKSNNGMMNGLSYEIEKWGNWILKKVKEEISFAYPNKDSENIDGYLWTRTITCQNPTCKSIIPIFKKFWLSEKKGIAFKPSVDDETINLKLVGNGYGKFPEKFDPSKGNISRVVRCLVCGMGIDSETVRQLFQQAKYQEKIAIVFTSINSTKKFRVSTTTDLNSFKECKSKLENKLIELRKKWGFHPIPDEETPESKGRGAERAFSLRNYGLNTWGSIFNGRQKLILLTFVEYIRKAYDQLLVEGYDKELAKIIVTYLSLNLDNLARTQSILTRYRSDTGSFEKVFSQSAIEMVYDYGEINPFRTESEWKKGLQSIIGVISNCEKISNDKIHVTVGNATALAFDDEYFDAVITDPPYYDNVPYSYFSDFFYVWLKRTIGYIYPDLFSTPLTPKSQEIVVYSNKEGGFESGMIFFEEMLQTSCREIHRVLKKEGIFVMVYAHKTTEGWEKLISSLLQSGLIITAAWPIRTELKGRRRSIKSASLASSIYIVGRKSQKEPIGFYREVKSELRKHLNKKLDQLWSEEIAGADFFIAAIGSAIEVFGKYDKVNDDSDNSISISKLLYDTREIVTNYAIQKVLHSEFSEEISAMTRFYILWRWAYSEAVVPFDDALKMAQSVGINIEHEWNKGFIIKEKENIRVIGPHERKEDELQNSFDLIDSLHYSLILWRNNKKEELSKLLKEKGYDKSDMFKRVAQAISESLPMESTEKKWLDGFLTGFRVDDSQAGRQTKLF